MDISIERGSEIVFIKNHIVSKWQSYNLTLGNMDPEHILLNIRSAAKSCTEIQ